MKRSALLLAMVLVGAACDAAPPPVSPANSPSTAVQPPPASPTALPTASPTAMPTVSAAPAATNSVPLPSPLPGMDPLEVELAATICRATYKGTEVGCHAPAPFDQPDQKPDGTLVAHAGASEDFCALRTVLQGSFTKAGAKQALAWFDNCKAKDGSMYGLDPGLAVLFESVDGHWVKVRDERYDLSSCALAKGADHKDVPFCQTSAGVGMDGGIISLSTIDVANDKQTSFAKIFFDGYSCWAVQPGFTSPHGLISASVKSLKIESGAGGSELVVEVDRSSRPASKELDTKMVAACQKNPKTVLSSLLPPPKRVRLRFSLAKGVKADPATDAALTQWMKESGEHGESLAKMIGG